MSNPNPQDDAKRFRDTIAPFDALFVWAYPVAWRNAMAAQALLGDRKNIERASDVKGAMRNVLREPVSMFAPYLTLVEPEECTSFDHVLVEWNGTRVAVRWGRIPSDGLIRRNPTGNTATVQNQGSLFVGLEETVGLVGDEVPLFTYSYKVARDYTLAGSPQAYMHAIKLCREWYDETEVIETLRVFDEPPEQSMPEIDDELIASRIRARASEETELKALVRSVRRKLA